MHEVTLDEVATAQLLGQTGQVTLRASNGRILGHFRPVTAEWPFTDEEVRQAAAQTGRGRKLTDILADLRKK